MLNFGFFLEGESSSNNGWITIVMLVVLFAFLYFFMIRPQKKQQQQDNEMRNALQVGDEVTTIGGIIGKVISIKGETFVLETTKDKTKIRFLKGAVRSVDVKVADVAAQVMEAGKETEVPENAPEFQEAPIEAADLETETDKEEK